MLRVWLSVLDVTGGPRGIKTFAHFKHEQGLAVSWVVLQGPLLLEERV